MPDQLLDLQAELARFADEREWGQFHDPKNLAMALSVEVGELLEIFQWLTPAQATEVMEDEGRALRVREELADILVYLLRLADVLGVDLRDAFEAKVNALAAALAEAMDGGKTALAARDAAVADLIPDLRLIVVYCETVAKGDRELLTSANIPLVSKSSGASGDPFIRKIWHARSGQIAMFVKAGENADSYVIRNGIEGTDPNTWSETKIANVKSAIVIGGLISGKRYGFQVCSLRRDGSCSAWSGSRTLMCG